MANTFKFSTLLWILAGILIPLWPVSLPLCWYLARRSYRSGRQPGGSLGDLHAAAELRKAGLLSEEEFEQAKAKTLGALRQ